VDRRPDAALICSIARCPGENICPWQQEEPRPRPPADTSCCARPRPATGLLSVTSTGDPVSPRETHVYKRSEMPSPASPLRRRSTPRCRAASGGLPGNSSHQRLWPFRARAGTGHFRASRTRNTCPPNHPEDRYYVLLRTTLAVRHRLATPSTPSTSRSCSRRWSSGPCRSSLLR
jgi:hypothetical protein